MPALPSPGKVIKAQLVWTIGTDTNCMNVLHYSYTSSAPAAVDLQSFAAALGAACPTSYLSNLSSLQKLTEVIATDLSSPTGLQGIANVSKQGTSPDTGNEPASASLVCQFQINQRYRGGHPRAYFPGLTQSHLQNMQQWSSATLATLQPLIQTWMQTPVGQTYGGLTGMQHVSVSYFHAHALRPTPQVFTVQGYSLNPIIGSQRRRLRGG